jgi:hypothetical protein
MSVCFLVLSLANFKVSACSLELAELKKKQEKSGMKCGACLYKNAQKPLA